MPPHINIRKGTINDLELMVDLETRGFKADNFSPEQFKYLLTDANSTVLIIEYGKRIAGEAVLLWRRGIKVARLYNIVIDPDLQGFGLGTKLLKACENEAIKRKRKILSLEVRTDNKNAIGFYKKHGFKITEKLPGYYSGIASGVRMVKTLRSELLKEIKLKVPYYAQTLDFTCGPASLMMVFKYFNRRLKLDQVLELELWREATLVFMTSGFGGTGPYGMAWASRKRGYRVKVILSTKQTPFFSSVRKKYKRAIIKLIHDNYQQKAEALGVKTEYADFTVEDIAREMKKGKLPIVLISTYHLHGDRAPHWVVITGFDSEYIYFHDPFVKFYSKNRKLAENVRIPLDEFRYLRRYGKNKYKCVLFIGPPRNKI
jgi:ribosomal protein S18 acetylase RimI-like enzyme/predicted double-glycine peptidase